MKNLNYDDANASVFLDYSSYGPVTGGTLTIYSSAGDEKQAATALDLYAGATLDGAASSGDTSFQLSIGDPGVAEGQLLQFENPKEVVEVQSYDSSTRIVKIRSQLLYDRADLVPIYGASVDQAVDTSTGEYEDGNHVVLVWALDGEQRREIALVSSSKYSSDIVLRRLQVLYPVSYELIKEDQTGFMREAQEMFEANLSMKGIEIDSMPNSTQVDYLFLYYCRWLAVSRGGESWDQEQERAWENYLRAEERFVKTPQWQDKDYDNKEETGETRIGDSLPRGRAF